MNKNFVFVVFDPIEGKPHHYQQTLVRKRASTFQEALNQLTATHPHHHVAEHLRGLWQIEYACCSQWGCQCRTFNGQ
jgi:hypothetical protein